MNTKICLYMSLVITAILLLSGCATDIKSLESFASLYYEHSPQKAYEFASKKNKNDKDLLWLMQSSISAYTISDDKAGELLEKSETLFGVFEEDGILSSGLAKTGATLVNDNAMSYRGNIYEGVFLNYYKALDKMQHNDLSGARVEFNRANDRQRRAKEYYTKQIQEVLDEQEEQYNQSDAKGVVDSSKSESQIEEILSSKYTNLDNFRAFNDFINPAISYISGLFFALEGDSKGESYLKEAYGMTNSEIIASDLVDYDSLHSQTHTWILLEEGRQASKTELSFSLPLITTSGLYHFGIALPQIVGGVSFGGHYSIISTNKEMAFDELINTDNIIYTEFEKQLRSIALRAIVSSSIKLAGQIGLSKGLEQISQTAGLLGSIVGSIYSMATTSADLRIMSVLPHRILLGKIQNTQGNIQISSEGKILANYTIQECQNQQHTQEAQAQKATQKTSKKSQKHPQILSICSNTNNIIYIRQTRNGVFTKILLEN